MNHIDFAIWMVLATLLFASAVRADALDYKQAYMETKERIENRIRGHKNAGYTFIGESDPYQTAGRLDELKQILETMERTLRPEALKECQRKKVDCSTEQSLCGTLWDPSY